jgi:hypothetical protein
MEHFHDFPPARLTDGILCKAMKHKGFLLSPGPLPAPPRPSLVLAPISENRTPY